MRVSIPHNLKMIRTRMDLSQEAFSKGMHVSKGMINQYEQGKALPQIDFLLRLTYLSGIQLERLLYQSLPLDAFPIDMDFQNLRDPESIVRNQVNLFDIRNLVEEVERIRAELEEMKKRQDKI